MALASYWGSTPVFCRRGTRTAYRSRSALQAAPRQIHTSDCSCCTGTYHQTGPSSASRSHRPLRACFKARAKRRSEAADAGEWAVLAQGGDDDDPEILKGITEVCNKGLRLMLRGETLRLEPFKDELSKFGQHFSDQGNLQGATFIYAVYQMADHMMPKQHENLQGTYLEAYTKMFNILEDSGWRLKKEGEEEDDDDKDLLPDQSAGYFQNAGL